MPAPRSLEYQGQELTLKEWSDMRNIPRNRLAQRLHLGWTVAQVLGFEPSPADVHRQGKANALSERGSKGHSKYRRGVEVDGITAPLRAHCSRRGVPYSAVYQRIRAGWTVERALQGWSPVL